MERPAAAPKEPPHRDVCDARPAPVRRRTALAGLAICLLGCSWFGAPEPEPVLDAASRDQRIEALTAAIRQDHVRLETLITEPRGETSVEIYRDPEIERIAHRLNQNERELDALRRSARNDSR